MGVRLGKKLHASRLVKLLQLVEHLLGIHLQLLDAYARQGERHLEVIAVLPYHFSNGIERRHVAALHDIGNASRILVVVIVVVIGPDVEEAVALEVYYLVYLKIQANCFHHRFFIVMFGFALLVKE